MTKKTKLPARTTSPDPWVPWFNRDKDGHITEAGIDTKDRWAGIAELKILIETIEYDNPDEVDALVEGDTRLLASAPTFKHALIMIGELTEMNGIMDANQLIDVMADIKGLVTAALTSQQS